VLKSPDLLGLMYFNLNGTNKWRLDGDNAALAKFAARAKDDAFGFDVRELK
jgi:hypothetical protein